MSEIYLVRHAQASYLSTNYDQLSDLGKEQATLLGRLFRSQGLAFDQAYVGPLVRQNQTIERIKNEGVFQDKQTLDHLTEHEGPQALKLYYEQLIKESDYVKKLWDAFQVNPSLKRKNSLMIFEYFIQKWISAEIEVEGVQSWKDFKANAIEALEEIRSNTNRGHKTLIVTSGGTIAAMLSHILKMSDTNEIAKINYMIRNTSVSKVLNTKNGLTMLSFNEVSHLPKEFHTFV